MPLTVRDRALAVATFRFVAVRLMETVARWTPTTPEMEAKVLFGKHIWDLAQHADALGRRTFELRATLHYSVPPHGEYLRLLEALDAVRDTTSRVAVLYDVVLPGLAARLARYEDAADPILDGPTLVITERIRRDLERMRAEAAALRREIELPPAETRSWQEREGAVHELQAEVHAS